MSAEIVTAIISAVTTLFISIGTWHVSMRQYRLKNSEMVTKAIDEVKDTVTANNADIQQHLALIDQRYKPYPTGWKSTTELLRGRTSWSRIPLYKRSR